MAKKSAKLPSYGDPPINEIAIAVQFAEIEALKAVHFGALHDLFKAELPVVEEYGQLAAKFETFPSGFGTHQFKFETQDKPPLPRAWFISADGHEVVQFQSDRLIRNWRKVEHKGIYPRFESVLPKFADSYGRVERLFETLSLGALVPNQCEISYFNNLFLREDQSFADACDWFFSPSIKVSLPDPGALSLEGESARFTIVLRMVGADGNPIGRLYIEATPAISDGRTMIRFQLVARGRPETEALKDIVSFMEAGHEAIVRSFDQLISDDAKKLWGKQ